MNEKFPGVWMLLKDGRYVKTSQMGLRVPGCQRPNRAGADIYQLLSSEMLERVRVMSTTKR